MTASPADPVKIAEAITPWTSWRLVPLLCCGIAFVAPGVSAQTLHLVSVGSIPGPADWVEVKDLVRRFPRTAGTGSNLQVLTDAALLPVRVSQVTPAKTKHFRGDSPEVANYLRSDEPDLNRVSAGDAPNRAIMHWSRAYSGLPARVIPSVVARLTPRMEPANRRAPRPSLADRVRRGSRSSPLPSPQ